MTYAALQRQARERHLDILGGFHPVPEDGLPNSCLTLLMLGPNEPRFWPAFTSSAEYQDGQADPVDRWSERIIGGWARTLDAKALYPFGGPPWLPFHSWALRTGRAHASPVNFLVHDRAGLFLSFRGALALTSHVDLPASAPSPCLACADKPCRTACPAGALTPGGYDVVGCRSYLGTNAGADNMMNGCNVRRSCPVSQEFGRLPAQSAYHMRQFKGDAS